MSVLGGRPNGDDVALLELDEEVPTDGLLTFEEEAIRQQHARAVRWRNWRVAAGVFAAVTGLVAIAATANLSTSTTKMEKSEVTELSEQIPLREKLAGNHFCIEFMHEQGCAWTKDYACEGQTEYRGEDLSPDHNLASNDQSIGYDCCCAEEFYKISAEDLYTADKNAAGVSDDVRRKWFEIDYRKAKGDAAPSETTAAPTETTAAPTETTAAPKPTEAPTEETTAAPAAPASGANSTAAGNATAPVVDVSAHTTAPPPPETTVPPAPETTAPPAKAEEDDSTTAKETVLKD